MSASTEPQRRAPPGATATRSLAARIARLPVGLGAVPGSPRRRRVWAHQGRIHAEARGLRGDRGRPVAAALRAELSALPGVDWVRVHGPFGRVVVSCADATDRPMAAVLAAMDRVELRLGLEGDPFGDPTAEYPDDPDPIDRQLFALAADGLALGLSTIGRLARMTPVPVEAVSFVSVIDSVPRIRGLVEQQLGPAAAELLLATASATATGLSQGTLGLLVDASSRIGAVGELRARQQVWRDREPALCATPWNPDTAPVPVEARSPGLPRGPVEKVGDRLPLVAGSAATVIGAASLSARRATQVLLAGMPKAAGAGREAFAAQLGRALATRGVLVTDPGVLRRLDRVDTVVVDARVLVTGQRLLDRPEILVPVPDLDDRLHELHDAFDPLAHARHGDWRLAPVDDLAVALPRGAKTTIRRLRTGGTPVLGLCHRDRLVALAPLRAQPDPRVAHLLRAVRDGAFRLAIAGRTDPVLADRFAPDEVLPAGRRAPAAVRRLQQQGRVVAVVAAELPRALAAADVGIGLLRAGGPGCWSADLVGGGDLDDAAFVLEAARVARDVSRRSAVIAVTGSAAAGAMTLTGTAATAGRRALTAVNGAALVSLAGGALAGLEVGRRPIRPPTDVMPWHAMAPGDVLEALGSGPNGLSPDEAARRRDSRGEHRSTPGLWRAVGSELRTPLTPILGVAAGMSSLIGSASDAVLVAGVLGVNALVGATQRIRTDQQMAVLREQVTTPVRAVREGRESTLPSEELVEGDVIRLRAGDPVPADCRILSETALEVDESSLTGESLPVRKHVAPTWSATVADRRSMLYRGTTLAAGTVQAVVVAIGAATEAGRGLTSPGEPPRPDGVEQRMAELTSRTVRWALTGGVLAASVGMLRTGSLRHTLGVGVNLAVAAVPEGLPILATAAQLSAARRLSRRGTLVREPRTIEALGRVDVLALDKTGTLTEGRIALQGVAVSGVLEPLAGLSPDGGATLAAAARACPQATVDAPLVHATDHAVLAGAHVAGVDADGDAPGWVRRVELPFEPARGFHATVGVTRGTTLLSVKGAPEVVLPRCTALRRDAATIALDRAARAREERWVDDLALRGYRVLAVAERTTTATELAVDDVDGLVLRGYVALSDPVRPTAAAAVDTVRSAGVDVVMITGDHPSTAEAVAAELGILNGGCTVTGARLDELDDDELDAILSEATVYARVTPAQKVRIVAALQRRGRVVAMTGDGANDAPAIRLADVGVALGVKGRTEAAREAADMVVTDDRVETLIDGIIEGRATWMAVRDALAILVGGNLGEIAYTVLGSALSRRPPINARQLLLVNLLTDMAPATAIAMRPPRRATPEQLLSEGPTASLGVALQRDLTIRAVSSGGGAAAAYVAARLTGRAARARTVGLVALVGSQLGQTVAVGGSPAVTATGLVSAAALAAIVQTPGLSQFFGCTPLGPVGWTIATTSSGGATALAAVLPRMLPTAHPTSTARDPRPAQQ